MVHEITKVTHEGGWQLRLTFANAEVRRIDIRELIEFDGVFAPLADQEHFAQVEVVPDLGSIAWPNGADLCPDVLYSHSTRVDFSAA